MPANRARLPDKVMVAPPPRPTARGQTEEEMAPNDMVDPLKSEGRRKEILAEIQKEAEAQRRREEALRRVLADPELSGPKTRLAASANPSAEGEIRLADLKGNRALSDYRDKVRRIIYERWVLMERIRKENPDLFAVFLVRLDAAGRIERYEKEQGSGNGAFDASAQRALNRVQVEGTPLPSPPPELKAEVEGKGFLFYFWARDFTGG